MVQSIQKKEEDWFSDAFDQFKGALVASSSIIAYPISGSIDVEAATQSDIQDYIKRIQTESPLKIIIQASIQKYRAIIQRDIHAFKSREGVALPSFNLMTVAKQKHLN